VLGVAAVAPSEKPIETHEADTHQQILDDTHTEQPEQSLAPCPICGAQMRIIELLTPQPHDTS
jgi:hypothetical protein